MSTASKIVVIPNIYYNRMQFSKLYINPIEPCIINIYINNYLIFHQHKSMETLCMSFLLNGTMYKLSINEENILSDPIRKVEIIIYGNYTKTYIPTNIK